MLLSDLPNDILRLISIGLNGFDNCFLWMASDSKLKKRLVNNVIIDFYIKYTISGRYLWPGNFLKRLQQLSRLSLVVDREVFHLPIHNFEQYPIPSLKYLQLVCTNSHEAFAAPDFLTTASDQSGYLKLNNLYPNLEYLEVKSHLLEYPLSIDFLRCLPQNLHTLLIPENLFSVGASSATFCVDNYLQILPTTLTRLEIHFSKPWNMYIADVDLSFDQLPNSLTSFSSNAHLKPVKKLPENLKELNLARPCAAKYKIDQLLTFLPTTLESLALHTDSTSPCGQSLSRFKNLRHLEIYGALQYPQFIASAVPNLKNFYASLIELQNLQSPPFKDGITTIHLDAIQGINSDLFSGFPQTVTSLAVVSRSALPPFPFFSILPKKLRSLRTNLTITEATSLLPDTLTDLRLSSEKQIIIDRLPSKLETLIFDAFIPQSTVKVLPRTLTHLDIHEGCVIDDKIVPTLPRGLKYLRCRRDKITDASSSSFPANLETLILADNTDMTDVAIANLPRSLIRIELLENSQLTDNCVPKLPPKLVYLTLPKAGQITPKSRMDLPKYLRRLQLRTSAIWKDQKANEMPEYLEQFV